MRSTLLSLPLTLAAGGGCVPHVEGETPLAPERRAYMEVLIAQAELATPMATALAARVEVGAMNARGEPATSDALAHDVANTAEWLSVAFTEGRIMEADVHRFSSDATIAQYDPGETEHYTDDHIVVATDITLWSVVTLVHEAGHKQFYHDGFVTQEIQDAGAAFNTGFATAVLRHRDYAFLLSALYNVPEHVLKENQGVIDAARERAETSADLNEWTTALRTLRDDLTMPTPEEAEDALREDIAEQVGMFAEFGMTIDDVIDAYRESGLYETTRAEREVCLKEFSEQYQEHLRESLRELRIR